MCVLCVCVCVCVCVRACVCVCVCVHMETTNLDPNFESCKFTV